MGEYYGLTVEALCKLMQYTGRDGVIEINKLGGIEEICEKLGTSRSQGLGKALEHRRATFGSNKVPTECSATFLGFLWNVLCDPTLVILLIFSGLAFLYFFSQIYGLVKLGCVVIAMLVTVIVNYCNERRFQCLIDDDTIKSEVTVIRNAVATKIVVDDVVVGDIVCIVNNNDVPADGILIECNGLKIDESTITGNSIYANKHVDLDPMLLSGTKIISGSGTMLAIAVGINSRKGIISSLLTENRNNVKGLHGHDTQFLSFRNERSILQQKVQRLFLNVIQVCFGFAAKIFVALSVQFVVRIFIVEQRSWQSFYFQTFINFLLRSVHIFVVGLPEAIPLTVAIVLAITMTKLFRNQQLVRSLHHSETMGNTTSICFDKTGTLTTNRMEIVQSFICGRELTWDLPENKLQVLPNNISKMIAENISINSASSSIVTYTADNTVEQIGNKTECALLGLVAKIGLNFHTIRETYSTHIAHSFCFNSDRKLMGTIIRISDGGYRLFVKGASEIVLSKCKFIIGESEKLMEMSNDIRDHITLNVVKPTTSNRLRTVTLAYRDFVINRTAVNETLMNGVPDWNDEMNIVKNLTCLGIFAIEDPIRDEVPDLVKKLQTTGITLRMVTGDDINTAKSVATKCGIIESDLDIVLDATEFNRRIRDSDGNIKQHLFDQVYPTLRVLARAVPMDKYNLVNGIVESTVNKHREVVAMVGDGENDALALKKADVGITFNQLSSNMAKNASNIILTNNKISGVLNTVIYGRHAYDSIVKFVQFILHVKLVSVTVITFEMVASPLDFQIYRADFFWNIMALVPIFFYDPIHDLVQGKPYRRTDHIISKNMFKNIVGQSTYQLVVLITFNFVNANFIGLQEGYTYLEEKGEFIFSLFVAMSIFSVFNARSLNCERNVFRKIQQNYPLCCIWILVFILHIFSILQYVYPTYFEVGPMNLTKWGVCLFFGVGILLWQQLLFFCNTERQFRKNTSEAYV